MEETPRKDESPQKPAKWLVRSRFSRIVIGSASVVVIYAAFSILWTHQREQQVLMAVKFARARVVVGYSGPAWIPAWFREHCPIFDRVHEVALVRGSLPAKIFSELGSLSAIKKLRLYDSDTIDVEIQHLKGLSSLNVLDLSHSHISDVGLAQIKSMKNLEHLFVGNTKISDEGLRHLSEMPNLKSLDLRSTETTEKGRELFHRAVPDCVIAANQ
jgi:hypothetical protein